MLRLLNLPTVVQNFVRTGKLSAGHARALVGNEDAEALAKHIVSKNLSVRETEKLAKAGFSQKSSSKKTAPEKDSDTRALENDLSANLGMKVAIDHEPSGKGRVTIAYKNLDDLDRLAAVLANPKAGSK